MSSSIVLYYNLNGSLFPYDWQNHEYILIQPFHMIYLLPHISSYPLKINTSIIPNVSEEYACSPYTSLH
jgi:hypothetical protein